MNFTKQKVDGLMGGVEVHYISDTKEPGFEVFEIVASIQGVQFRGRSPHLSTTDDLDTLAKTVGAACSEHRGLLKCKLSLGSH
jgi:hypothetical protein